MVEIDNKELSEMEAKILSYEIHMKWQDELIKTLDQRVLSLCEQVGKLKGLHSHFVDDLKYFRPIRGGFQISGLFTNATLTRTHVYNHQCYECKEDVLETMSVNGKGICVPCFKKDFTPVWDKILNYTDKDTPVRSVMTSKDFKKINDVHDNLPTEEEQRKEDMQDMIEMEREKKREDENNDNDDEH